MFVIINGKSQECIHAVFNTREEAVHHLWLLYLEDAIYDNEVPEYTKDNVEEFYEDYRWIEELVPTTKWWSEEVEQKLLKWYDEIIKLNTTDHSKNSG